MLPSVMCRYLVFLGLLIISNIDGALTCRTATLEECHTLPFVPGYERAGEGYDVVKLEHKGAYVFDVYNYLSPTNSCWICSNPMMNGQLQKLPYYMADWRSQNQCKRELETSSFISVVSAVESASSVITNDWTIGLGLRDVVGDVQMAGSLSKMHSFTSSSSDKSITVVNQFSCAHYRFRASSTYPLSGEFQRDIRSLPLNYTPITTASYRRLIDRYGTHYIDQVDLGGRMSKVTTISTCRANLAEEFQVEHCLSAATKFGLGFQLGDVDLDILGSEECKKVINNYDIGEEKGFLKHMAEVVGGNDWSGEFSLETEDSDGFALWKDSLKSIPDILSFTITPLHLLVTDSNVRSNLRAAIRDYVIENGINKTETETLKCAPKPPSPSPPSGIMSLDQR